MNMFVGDVDPVKGGLQTKVVFHNLNISQVGAEPGEEPKSGEKNSGWKEDIGITNGWPTYPLSLDAIPESEAYYSKDEGRDPNSAHHSVVKQ